MLSNDNQYSDNDDVPYWEFIYGHGDILNNVFSMLICTTCYCKLKLTQNEKEGLAFRIILKYCGCEWKHEFYTSTKKSKHYEVNRRMVYVMRIDVV